MKLKGAHLWNVRVSTEMSTFLIITRRRNFTQAAAKAKRCVREMCIRGARIVSIQHGGVIDA